MTHSPEPDAPRRSPTLVTIPNLICALRIALSPLMVVFAARGERLPLVVLFVLLTMSDWVDGKLARLLDQRSEIGPRLDTVADGAMYASLLVAMVWIDTPRLLAEAPWFLAGILGWAAMISVSLLKFRRWPSLHTRGAKISWGLAAIGAVAFLGQWATWPLRLALASATLANLHAIAILHVLPAWHSDVPNLRAARALRDQTRSPPG